LQSQKVEVTSEGSQESPRAGELKVLIVLVTGIPENTALFEPTLSYTKGYLQLPLAGFAG
jgi:hypothetical protein